MKKKKKREGFAPAPVATGHDGRPEERSAGEPFEDGAEAPDGISGDWD
ncbi:MAG: hypothetical protein Q4E20_02125 [Eubacteriales bacterium]|nr:hypothetical protein [Eubacteriales bacterium]